MKPLNVMLATIIATVSLYLIEAFAQTPTPAPPRSGVYCWINLDQATIIYQKKTPNVYRVEYYNSVSDVIGNPITVPPVTGTSFVKMELAVENTP